MQRDASLGERERLLVLVPHERDVRLVVHDPREHIVCLDRHRETLALPESRRSFFTAARLREKDRGQRMDEGEVAAIACRVKCRGGFSEVFADDARVANLLVAEGELVVGEPDGT